MSVSSHKAREHVALHGKSQSVGVAVHFAGEEMIIWCRLSTKGGTDGALTSYILLNQGHWSRIQPFSRNWKTQGQSPPWCFCVAHNCTSALALVSLTRTPDF